MTAITRCLPGAHRQGMAVQWPAADGDRRPAVVYWINPFRNAYAVISAFDWKFIFSSTRLR